MKVNVVADACCNHQGNIGIACEMIREAADKGADYIKFQKRDMSCVDNPDRPYNGFGATYGEHRAALELSDSRWDEMDACAKACGIKMMATPFDIPSVRFVVSRGYDYVKIGSGQVMNKQFLAGAKKILGEHPVIISSGMCMLADIMETIGFMSIGQPMVVMQCTSSYPCDESDINLAVIPVFRGIFGTMADVGLSGHYASGSGAVEAAAAAIGATWIERHFTLDRTWKGTDHSASLEPEGLKRVVKAVRSVEKAIGSTHKHRIDCELPVYNKCYGV